MKYKIFLLFCLSLTVYCHNFLNNFYTSPSPIVERSAFLEIEKLEDNLLIAQKTMNTDNSEILYMKIISYEGEILKDKQLISNDKICFIRDLQLYNNKVYLLYGTNLDGLIEMNLMILDYDLNIIKDKKLIEFEAEFMIGTLYFYDSKIYFPGGYSELDKNNQRYFIYVYDSDINEIGSYQRNEDKMLKSICIIDDYIYIGKYRSSQAILTKLDLEFNEIDSKILSNMHEQIDQIRIHEDGFVILSYGYGDIALSKYDCNLNLIYENSFGYDLTDVQNKFQIENDLFITCGYYNSSYIPYHAFNANVTVLDSDFNVLNTIVYDESSEIRSFFYDLTITENGRIFLVGDYNKCAWLFESDLEGNYNPIAPIEENISEDIKFYNYPNPFNPETNICFYLESSSNVDLSIYNLKGEKVTSIYNGFLDKGDQSFSWKPLGDLSSGVYFSVLEINGDKRITKMIYNK